MDPTAAAPSSPELLSLHDDALGSVVLALLRDPAYPSIAALAATCGRLRVVVRAQRGEVERQMVEALHAKLVNSLKRGGHDQRQAELNLAGRQLHKQDCTVLACQLQSEAALPSARLFELNLNNNAIEDGLVRLPWRAPALHDLSRLYLNGNGITDSGARSLAAALGAGALPALQRLSLGQNKIACGGATALAEAARGGACADLRRLHLHFNEVGDAGMKALADALHAGAFGVLAKLYVDANAWSSVGRRAVLGACTARGGSLQHDLGLGGGASPWQRHPQPAQPDPAAGLAATAPDGSEAGGSRHCTIS